jgi:glycerol-3-phosphate acyltransferase PlsX
MSIRVAVDAMGGDHAPQAVVQGALNVAERLKDRAEILLVGQASQVQALLDEAGYSGTNIKVVDAPEVIGMGESPSTAVKLKTKSSIHVGLGLVKSGQAQAFTSAGNTGAVMAASLFILGRIEGVLRPSVLAYYPTTESYCIVVDAGTNVDCKPEHLVQFAQMGSVYASRIMKRENPVVALMNVGEEPGKGNEAVKAAFNLLQTASGINFRGNIEGRDLLGHAADVVVCDGFVGNIMLKLGESVATSLKVMIAQEMQKLQLKPEEQQLVAQVMGAVQRRFDYEEYGGAPLLGVAGNVLISHGSSTAKGFEQAVLAGVRIAEQDVAGAIASSLK